MVGTGYALHMRFRHFVGNVDWDHTIAVDDHRLSNGQCANDDISDYGDHFAVLQWNATQHDLVACPIGGSIRVYAPGGDHGAVEVKFNMIWSDGTAWTNRSMTAIDLEPL